MSDFAQGAYDSANRLESENRQLKERLVEADAEIVRLRVGYQSMVDRFKWPVNQIAKVMLCASNERYIKQDGSERPADSFDIYEETVDLWHQSVLTGGQEHRKDSSLSELRDSGIPLLREFELDNDIQYMKIVSTNLGMIRTYQKRRKAKRGGR